jgi:hypothetical protein
MDKDLHTWSSRRDTVGCLMRHGRVLAETPLDSRRDRVPRALHSSGNPVGSGTSPCPRRNRSDRREGWGTGKRRGSSGDRVQFLGRHGPERGSPRSDGHEHVATGNPHQQCRLPKKGVSHIPIGSHRQDVTLERPQLRGEFFEQWHLVPVLVECDRFRDFGTPAWQVRVNVPYAASLTRPHSLSVIAPPAPRGGSDFLLVTVCR